MNGPSLGKVGSMSKANVDPAELRRFAADLNRFNQELTGLLQGLHGRMRNLEQSWRDQEQKKFTEAFETTARTLTQFLEASHTHVQFLGKKATAIEEYLRQR
jgi:WXG100 family type VII secretion target